MQGAPPTPTQPQSSSVELGGAHIIFDALFILYFMIAGTIGAVDMIS
jgi:hypothetical protein